MKLLQSASFTHSFTAQLAKYFTRDGSSTLAGDLRTAKARQLSHNHLSLLPQYVSAVFLGSLSHNDASSFPTAAW